MYHNLLIIIAVFTLYQAFRLRKNWKRWESSQCSIDSRFKEYCNG